MILQRQPKGLHFRDQQTYTLAEVEAHLPAIWDPEWILTPKHRNAVEVGIRTKGDPKHISGQLIGAADVQIAFRRCGLDNAERECLRHVHHLGYSPGELGEIWSVAPEQVQRACMTGIEKITLYLNGKVPK